MLGRILILESYHIYVIAKRAGMGAAPGVFVLVPQLIAGTLEICASTL